MELTGAIFDLDGTLLDSMPYWASVGTRYLEEQHVVVPDIEQLALRIKTMTLPEAADYFRSDYGVQEPQDAICARINHMIEDDYRLRAPLKAGTKEMLEQMKQRGVKMCVASATDHALVEAALRRVGVLEYFSFILTCGDLQTSKNLPYIFDTCTERLGTDKRTTAVFEDSLHCVITASGAGYPVVGVYDDSAKTETEEIRRLSRCFLNNWEELDFDRLEQTLQ